MDGASISSLVPALVYFSRESGSIGPALWPVRLRPTDAGTPPIYPPVCLAQIAKDFVLLLLIVNQVEKKIKLRWNQTDNKQTTMYIIWRNKVGSRR